ncbi:MAG TPA: hypothetical protein VGV92_00515 [Gammaproteobacteria bacterium]|nr:hypothetical protein [Gammaproteobacteria bacterium]
MKERKPAEAVTRFKKQVVRNGVIDISQFICFMRQQMEQSDFQQSDVEKAICAEITKANASVANPCNGVTPLHSAAVVGFSDVIEKLINCGARSDARNAKGQVPLHSAVLSADVLIIGQLVLNGVPDDLNAKDESGQSPLDLLVKDSDFFAKFLRRVVSKIEEHKRVLGEAKAFVEQFEPRLKTMGPPSAKKEYEKRVFDRKNMIRICEDLIKNSEMVLSKIDLALLLQTNRLLPETLKRYFQENTFKCLPRDQRIAVVKSLESIMSSSESNTQTKEKLAVELLCEHQLYKIATLMGLVLNRKQSIPQRDVVRMLMRYTLLPPHNVPANFQVVFSAEQEEKPELPKVTLS